MQADIEQVLIDRHAIAARVRELAEQIASDLGPAMDQADQHITLVPILTGSIIFVSDLIRHMPMRMQIKVISVTSYPGKATASRGASLEASLTKLPASLEGRHVLVVDDILDSGHTLSHVRDIIEQRQPASYRSCVLLRKQRPQALNTANDYVAFDIPDAFVVGYGLDYDDYYRNLPDICTLRREVYQR